MKAAPSGQDKYERIRKLGQGRTFSDVLGSHEAPNVHSPTPFAGSFGSVFLVRDVRDKKMLVLKEVIEGSIFSSFFRALFC